MRSSSNRVLRAALALLLTAVAAWAADPVRLSRDGWFRTSHGKLFVPLGGFHGNELPLAFLKLDPEEAARVAPHVWDSQTTAGLGHVDLWDASDRTLRRWFELLAANGVTAIRLFPRARVDGDTLDLCGKLNPELQQVFHRTFAAARRAHIRVLLQILPEPQITGYWNHALVEKYALPRYSSDDLGSLLPAQRRFLLERKEVRYADWFTDPDVLACQKRYLGSALAWVAREPQVFALEVYNEQGLSRPPPDRLSAFPARWEDAEIAWTAEIVRFIHERLPGMPVTISHPGSGLAGYDPIEWSRRSGVDFYSTHLYAGDCGESSQADFAEVTAATTAVVRREIPTFPGEWGVLNNPAPEEVRRRAHRDALWMSLTAGASGFMQWTYDFLDEYRQARRIVHQLPREFSPDPPAPAPEIAEAWRAFAATSSTPPYFALNHARAQDPNLQRILTTYAGRKSNGPIRTEGGYEISTLADTPHRIWIAYLRSREIRAYGKTFLGVPRKAGLTLVFDLPSGKKYRAELTDLSTGQLQRMRLNPRDRWQVSASTDDDYVLVVRK